jgi:integrase
MDSRKAKITKRVVDALPPHSIVWDTTQAGFAIRRQFRDPVYIFKTRIGSRQRWFTIGGHGTWTVEKARQEARAIQGEIDRGKDPAAKRDAEAKMPTMATLVGRFLKEAVEPTRAPATATLYRDLWERLGKSELGKLKVGEVQHRDIASLHYKHRTTPVTSNRLVAMLSSFFSWCERNGFREKHSNPALGIEKFKEKSRERFLSPRELARLGIAVARAERKKTETPFAIAALRLLLFTGCRRDEILKLRWRDVHLDKAMLLLPDTKTGARPVYLSAPALAVLGSIPRIANNPFVIAGEREKQHLVNLRKVWLRICKVARLKGVRLHDLRHSFASVGVAGGASLPIVGKLLGHTKGATTEKYSHLAADPVRAANEAVGEQIAAMMSGRKGRVVPLNKAASR